MYIRGCHNNIICAVDINVANIKYQVQAPLTHLYDILVLRTFVKYGRRYRKLVAPEASARDLSPQPVCTCAPTHTPMPIEAVYRADVTL